MPKGRPKGFDEQIVLGRAMQTFWREGYNGASMSLLLKEMGISRQSLYDTYGDKRSLFLQSLRLYQEREVAPIIDLLKSPLPEGEKLLAVISHYHGMTLQEQPKGCFIVNSLINLRPNDHELASILNESIENLRQALINSIQRAMTSGLIPSTQAAAETASGLLNALIGLAASSKSTQSTDQIDQTVAAIKSSLGLS